MAGVENPYQPPHEVELPAASALRPGLYPLARLATLSLRLYLASTVYIVVAHLYDTFIAPPSLVSLHDEIATTMPSEILEVVIEIVNWVSVILFFIWKYRAAANARVLDPQAMKISPGMAVIGYFIPLVNLVLPCMAMAGIARASRVERFWPIAWSLCYVGIFFLAVAMVVIGVEVERMDMDKAEAWAVLVEHLIVVWSVLMYFFAWQIMMRITRAQMEPESEVEKAIPA
jgi:hypothetical protein